MAYTAHSNAESVQEHFDSAEVLQNSAKQLAELLRKSKHAIVFTGAGVSTLCGIPDFRGPTGVWTLAAAGEKRVGPATNAAQAIPSFTHMSLVELERRGILKFLISQNCDGLHRKSGIPPNRISELHGNRNLEKCSKCAKEYLRDFDATAAYIFSVHDHRTGRKCVKCNADLLDSIINFGDNLREEDLNAAWDNTNKADLCLVIGSSCTVKPACLMPEQVGKNRKANLIVCNLQHTPLDNLSAPRIYAKSDDLMKIVMKELDIQVPPFTLHRRVCVNVDISQSRAHVYAVDSDGTPASIFPGVVINGKNLEGEPFVNSFHPSATVDIELFFYGHYNEPPVKLQVPSSKTGRNYYDLVYNPMTGIWQCQYKGDTVQFLSSNYVPPPFPDISQISAKAQPVGFSVEPREDCPHFQSEVAIGVSGMIGNAFRQTACYKCKDQSENWICLTCGKTCCSRYVNGHAKEHAESERHNIALSFSDLSVWCYACSDYIKDPFLTTMFVGELHKAKFGEHDK